MEEVIIISKHNTQKEFEIIRNAGYKFPNPIQVKSVGEVVDRLLISGVTLNITKSKNNVTNILVSDDSDPRYNLGIK